MAARIDMSNNQANIAYVGAKPWHGLGQEIKPADYYNVEVFKKAAGLNFEVGVEAIYRPNGELIQEARSFVRKDTNKLLGVVGPNTQPLQNWEAFSFFKPFLDEKIAALHTAGSLDEGRKVWVLAHIQGKNMEVIKNDPVEKYILLSNSHDGSMAVRIGYTPIRVVCWNTLSAAHGSAASKLIRIRHTRNMRQDLEDVRSIMEVANATFNATLEQFKALARKSINQGDLRKYVNLVMTKKEDTTDASTRMKNIIDGIIVLHETGRGTNIPGVQGTLWGAYNAVTEYLQWEQGRNEENRLKNAWFGSSVQTNEHALSVALDMAM